MSYSIKRGDRAPSITCELAASDVLDLTGCTVKFIMRLASAAAASAKVNALATIVSPTTPCTVRYDWGLTDTDTAGHYACEWEVTFVGGIKRTFPNNGHLFVDVVADLG